MVTELIDRIISGCFQCCRRRIICDRTEPVCNKCVKKGIECSGLKRIRFTDGVARRGRLKDFKVPDVRADSATFLPTETSFDQVRWQNDRKVGKRKPALPPKKVVNRQPKESFNVQDQSGVTVFGTGNVIINRTELQEQQEQGYLGSPGESILDPLRAIQPCLAQEVAQQFEEDVEEIVRSEDSVVLHSIVDQSVQPWLPQLSAEARMLFSHFSDTVAPAMVILDTDSNGYRRLILPMALEDEILRRAVGVVAAQHLSRVRPEMKDAAEAGRAAIISRLRQNAMTETADSVFNRFTWATLLVLLVGETVTGSADYGFLVHMLLCLAANSRTQGDTEIAKFLQTQTNMFEMLGSPLLREENGVLAISYFSKSWQDWLTCESFDEDVENRRILDKIRMCFNYACDIYLRRATCDSAEPHVPQSAAVEDLMNHMAQISPDGPGGHSLVWPCYVAGAEASELHQREFFVNYMKSIYARTKFLNIPVAVQNLEDLWKSKGVGRWTRRLNEHTKTLVM